MKKLALTNSANQVAWNRPGISCSQEIDLRHATERCSTDQSRNGWKMRYFCHFLPSATIWNHRCQKDEIPILLQHSCRNAKVVAFCDPDCRLSTYTSRHRCTGRVGLSPGNGFGADIKIPIVLAASQCPTHRDFVPWRFSAAGRRSAWWDCRCRRPKTCTPADSCSATKDRLIWSPCRRRPAAYFRAHSARRTGHADRPHPALGQETHAFTHGTSCPFRLNSS